MSLGKFHRYIHELYGAAIGRITRTDAQLVQLVHRWMVCDWGRVVLIAVGFISAVGAISLDPADARA